MMTELTSKLGLRQEHSSPYYPQANGQVEAVNKTLKTILQRTINSTKSNWHLMLYSTLWDYQTSVKIATGFSPFQLIYGLEVVFPIEC
jgi:transposase InsO family protein